MQLKEIMSTDVEVIKPESSITEAEKKMRSLDVLFHLADSNVTHDHGENDQTLFSKGHADVVGRLGVII